MRFRLTLRASWWAVAIAAGAVQLLTIGLVIGGILSAGASGGEADDLRAQQLLVSNLRQGVWEQELGIEGYASSGDPRQLVVYTAGGKDVDAALQRLGTETAGTPRAVRVVLARSAAGDWQRWAEGVRARTASARRPVRNAAADPDGQRLLTHLVAVIDQLQSELDGAERTADAGRASAWSFAAVALLVGSVLVGAVLVVGTARAADRSVRLAQGLAAAAREIAGDGQVRIPYAERPDEIGELARALKAWQRAASEREIVIRQAPIGICQLDAERNLVSVSPAFARMLGLPVGQVEGRPMRSFIHPDDLDAERGTPLSGLIAGTMDRVALEHRMIRADGGVLWVSVTFAAVRGADGLLEGFVGIVEDISERRQQTERAAQIQRELLPRTTPVLEGYDLAGACRPAQDVAGDFYDWTLWEDGRHLDLTVADVMGKGLGSGLVMATVRAVLRAASPELGPADRVRLAAEFLPQGAENDGLFVTLFQGRLDLVTGVLTFVDAGHGYAVVRRAGGELVHLRQRSMPVGILPDQTFLEGTVHLELGDTLIVHSDGLVETEERTGDLGEYADDLEEESDAQETVWRLMRHLPSHAVRLQDDVTVVALHRRPLSSGLWPAEGRSLQPAATARLEADPGSAQEEPSESRPDGFQAPPPAPPAREPEPDDLDDAGGGGRLLGLLGAPTQTPSLRASIVFATFLHVVMLVLVTAGILVGSARGGAADDLRTQQLQLASLRQGVLEQEVGISGYASSDDPGRLAQ